MILRWMAVITLMGATILSSSALSEDNPSGLDKTVQELVSKIVFETNMTKKLLQRDKEELKKQLTTLKENLHNQEASLDKLKSSYKRLDEKEQEQRKALKKEKETIQAVQGTVMAASRKTKEMLKNSPISPEYQSKRELINNILEEKYFPGMSDIRELNHLWFSYMEDSAEIVKYSGRFMDDNGKEVSGEIVRIGSIGAIYKKKAKDHEVGYLRNGPQGKNLVELAGEPSWFVKQDLEGFINGQQRHLPLDISGGAAFKRMVQEKSWQEWIQSGGLLVWPIFFVGILAIIIGCERVISLLRIRSNSDRIMKTITELADKDQWQECREFCERNQQYPTCQILKSALKHLGSTQRVVENALQEALLRQLPRLERFLPTLSVLAAIAPLLGLLGTVTGMINTFQVITIFGIGDPKLMAGGISEALITTQLGLAVAIPIMFLHHFLERRVDKILGDIEEKGSSFTLTLLRKEQIQGRDLEDG